MALEGLKEKVCLANQELAAKGVVLYTWGNVSGIDRSSGHIIIKPSGVPYKDLTPEAMVVLDLETGQQVEGSLRPSSDTPTHIELYKAFPHIGGITHTHSTTAVAFAQAGLSIPMLGTTHADYFYGEIPCTRALEEKEVLEAYETNTGKVIVEAFIAKGLDPLATPGVLVKHHGPFTFGKDPMNSVYHAVVLEEIALMAFRTLQLKGSAQLPSYIGDKHYNRKHGAKAYYGQKQNRI